MSGNKRETIKSVLPFLVEPVRYAKRRKNELSALGRHLARKQYQKNNESFNHEKIKVVFICQYIPAWSKNKQLYETLTKDEQFDVYLLCIPSGVSANQLVNPDDLSNDTYEYFSNHGYQKAINALIGRNTWLDLKQIRPDYVFYNRYDRPMPIPYTSTSVSSYAKVCLIVYGCALLKSEESMIDKKFGANTYCFFAESEGIRKEFVKWNQFLCGMKFSNAICCGIPAVENAYKAKNDDAESWEFSQNEFRVIYTPRWTTEPAWGGSSFIKYKDFFLNLADENPDMDILLRPHPLMFGNFIGKGIMSEAEVDEFKNSCLSRANIRLDIEKEYHATFWNSSVLITDYSSMIIEYFVTGKPIIYLTFDQKIEYTDQMQMMLECSYIVNNEKELKEAVENLSKGIDPLAEKRRAVCEKEFLGQNNINASENMKQVLIDHYRK